MPATRPAVDLPVNLTVVLTVLVVSYNTRALLLDCLASLEDATTGDGCPPLVYETIVVDNGSSDGSIEGVRAAYPAVRVIANARNQGFVRANNQGIAVAHGRYILLLNSDTVATSGSIARMVHFADGQPAVGIVGARLVYPDGAPQNSWADFPTLRSEFTGRNVQQHGRALVAPSWNALDVDWVNGAAFLCRRAMLEGIGLLDEAIFMYSEETDLCYRARTAGWQVASLEDATVMHWGGASAGSHSVRKLRLLYGSKLYFFRKHYGKARTIALRVCLIVATLCGIVRRGARMLLRKDTRAATMPALHARWKLLGYLLHPSQSNAAFSNLPPGNCPNHPPNHSSVQHR